MQFTAAALTEIYDAISAEDAFLETATLKLAMNNLTPTKDTVAADITPPNFTGYTAPAIAAWTSAVDIQGVPYLCAAPSVLSPTDAVNLPMNIYGAGVLDSAGALVCYSKFPQPLLISRANQQLHITAKIKLNDVQTVELEGYVE